MTDDPTEKKFRAWFEKTDLTKKGKIDRDTLARAFREKEHPLFKSNDHIDQLFQKIDHKHDDLIDYNEFKSYFQKAEGEIKHAFDNIDKNHDGYLTKTDLRSYLEDNLNIKATDEDFEDFYKNVDQDHDGLIRYDEWRNLLLLVPRNQGSRLKTAFRYFNEDVDLSSDGDMTIINDYLKGVGYFISGGVAGVVSRTCTAPFDRIKVFLIARTDLSSTLLTKKREISKRNANHPPLNKIKSPLIKAAQSLYKQGGLKSFYVGNGLNCLKVFPEAAMKFGSFEIGKNIFMKIEGKSSTNDLSRFSTYLAGGFAGMFSQFTVYPVDTLKYRIQCAPLRENRQGIIWRTAKEMYKEGGLRLFYRGIFVGVTGIFPYAAIDLGTFTTLKQIMIRRKANREGKREDDVKLSNFVVLPLGAFSGTVGACVVYPINLLRTRLQAQGTFAHPYRYTGIKDVFKQTIQREGYPGLYKGLSPNLAKVIPAVSITYLVVENMKRALNLE
ncbi:Ca(2+)-binding ATP:ADP antiporter [Saccharomycopsis crataegensis]|uniref:Ca(2+)-binding ATP:ADP antiporter n=1 Tax=Saccharomycopsis crataegensis TaxID=43959 RepID=A0AAV5QLG0_9ASCO|nr:Ca(2+)-binding ATP:ADP antiporter [Saccharomycopsis crataegensis]